MENEKKNKFLIGLICVFILLVFTIGLVILYNNFIQKSQRNNEKNDNKNAKVSENIIDNIVIKNEEINVLFNYVQPNLNSNYVCLGYFYQNPYKNHTLTDKVSLTLINYAAKQKKKIDDNFLKKINLSDREFIKNSSDYYIEANIVKEGLKLIYNVDIDKFDDNENYVWNYREDANAFVEIISGGDYQAKILQQIIDYNELEDEINLTIVKAELGYDGKVYRYINNKNTLVYNNSNNFKFSKENIDKFPQLKYIFKKNAKGNYYISDIINLNFEEDFVDCN